jgi:hypothetical protein
VIAPHAEARSHVVNGDRRIWLPDARDKRRHDDGAVIMAGPPMRALCDVPAQIHIVPFATDAIAACVLRLIKTTLQQGTKDGGGRGKPAARPNPG